MDRRELYTAIDLGKNIIAVLETDDQKGGASLQEMKRECMECCTDRPDALEKVFQRPPILWVRVHDFQLVSLKMISLRILYELKSASQRALDKGVYVPGELTPVVLDPLTILVCKQNERAFEVAAEARGRTPDIRIVDASKYIAGETGRRSMASNRISRASSAAGSARPRPPPPDAAIEEAAANPHVEVGVSSPRSRVFFLLYLNKKTFLDEEEETARCVRGALNKGIPVVLVHEMDSDRGGVPFRVFFANTPEDLMINYGLYNTVAVPLYTQPPYRAVSIILIRKALGGRAIRIRPTVWKLALRPFRRPHLARGDTSFEQLTSDAARIRAAREEANEQGRSRWTGFSARAIIQRSDPSWVRGGGGSLERANPSWSLSSTLERADPSWARGDGTLERADPSWAQGRMNPSWARGANAPPTVAEVSHPSAQQLHGRMADEEENIESAPTEVERV